MRKVGIISVHLGWGSAAPVEPSHVDFFLDTAETVIGDDVQLVQDMPIPVLAIDSLTCNTRSGDIFGHIYNYANDLMAISEAAGEKVEGLIVNLEVSQGIKGSALSIVARAIDSLVGEVANDNGIVIVLQHSFPDEKDAYLKCLMTHVYDGHLVLINDDGTAMSSNDLVNFDPLNYKIKLSNISPHPIERLRSKLIRQRGHFKRLRHGKHSHCVGFYFNGKHCELEVMQLLQEHIEKNYPQNAQPCVVYYSSMTNWIIDPVIRLCSEKGYEYYSFEEISASDDDGISLESSPVLLIAPLVDSGNTLGEKVTYLNGKNPSNIEAVTMLSTHGASETCGKITIPGGHEVQYFLRVQQQQHLNEDDQCPMCQLGIPFSEEGKEPCDMLTAYDFWEIVQQVGLKEEENVPEEWRTSLGKVPNFPAMLDQDQDGAWIAEKVVSFLKKAAGKENVEASDLAVICPKQRGSEALTEYLRIVFDLNVIRIDEGDIKRAQTIADVNELRTIWAKENSLWYSQLISSATPEFIVMDEFTASGGMRKGMVRILNILNKTPICHFSMMDFFPGNSSSFSEPCFSLYAWKAHQIECHQAG